jgi:hypothetical protein
LIEFSDIIAVLVYFVLVMVLAVDEVDDVCFGVVYKVVDVGWNVSILYPYTW